MKLLCRLFKPTQTKADLIKTIVLIGGLQIAIITALLLKLSQTITH